jgi:hypothetical protein
MNRQYGGVMVAVLGVVLLIGGLRGTWQRALHALWTDLPAPSGGGGSGTPPTVVPGDPSQPANPSDPADPNAGLSCPSGYFLFNRQCYASIPGAPSPIPATPTTAGIPAGAAGSYIKTA